MKSEGISIHEITKLTGVTVRTVHYYEEKGLLKSQKRNKTNHRVYSQENLYKLLELLFYKEIGFSLEEISKLLAVDIYSKEEIFKRYLKILNLKRGWTEKLIGLASDYIAGKEDITFKVFSNRELSDIKGKYKEEILLLYNHTRK